MKLFLFIVFAVLWTLDTIFTVIFVGKYGLSAEGNPLMRWVIAEWSPAGFAALKIGLLMFWACVCNKAHIVIHIFFVLIMLPVVWMGFQMAV